MLKNKLVYITLFMLFQNTLFYSQLSALDFDKHQGYWSVGVQYGNAYQWSDVDSEVNGWGTSITLGKNLYFDEFSMFTIDLRSRLFFGVSKGLDGSANVNISQNEALNGTQDHNYLSEPGYFYNNYKNSLFSLDLEPNLLVNKFRGNTGWFFNFFGGAGFGFYNTRMNLADESGSYSSRLQTINQNASESALKKELKDLMDQKYESKADGFYKNQLKAGFMPSAGFEIGYDINRFLTAYLGHRTVFSRKDNLDGQIHGDPDKDLLNFTHVGLQVNFSKDRKNNKSSYNNHNAKSNSDLVTFNDVQEHGYPIVRIAYPEIDWFNTSKDEMEVIAELENVFSVLDISCMVNGKEVAFDYDKDKVRFYAYLQRGTNVLKVQVRNDKGEARDIKRVIYTPVENEENVVEQFENDKPGIELLSPMDLNHYSEEDIIEIKAFIENVEVKDDIKLSANGMDLTTFKFDPDLGILSIKVRLAKGTNKFMLTAYNATGKSEQEFRIYYGVDPENEIVVEEETGGENDNTEEEEYPPLESNTKPYIALLSPEANPYYTRQDKVFFQVETHGVNHQDDITFLINGRKNIFFDYDRNNKILSDEIHLMDLTTTIVITISNEFGVAEKEVKVIYGDAPDNEPEVTQKIIQNVEVSKPDEDCQSEFLAIFNENVRKDDIKITMNEFELRNFRYKESDRELKFSLYLDEGTNDVQINVAVDEKTETARINLNCGEGSSGEIIVDTGDEDLIIDTSPASISSIQPKDELVTEEEDVILRFRAHHVKHADDIMIFLNDHLVREFEFDIISGNVQAMVSLLPNENELIIRVNNEYGSDERTLLYFYDEPFKTQPEIVINSPRNGFTTDETTVIFRASVDFIKSIDKVEVLLNGKELKDYNYNSEYGKIQAIIPLRLGNNSIEVIAENRMGTSSEKVNFKYKLPYEPAVMIIGPKEGLEYRKSFAMLSGVVQNMKDKRGIGIQINNKPFKSFSYDESTEMVSSKLLLEKGNNEIILSAKNEYGFASDTIHLFFKGAPEKPSITFITPANDEVRTSNALYNLEAEVLEINHSINVELTVNGRNIEEVYYFKNEKLVRAEFNLKKGRNDIKLTATNDTGVSSSRTSVYLQ